MRRPKPFDVFHVELGHDFTTVSGAFIEGDKIGEFRGGDHDPGGVGACVADVSFEILGRVDEALYLDITLGGLPEAWLFLKGIVKRDLELIRDELGDAVHFTVGHVHHAADVAEDALGEHAAEGDDLADVVAPVFFLNIADDLVAALHAEVDVDIRRADALGVEETLKKKGVAERIDAGDAEGVCGEAARRRTPARAPRGCPALSHSG